MAPAFGTSCAEACESRRRDDRDHQRNQFGDRRTDSAGDAAGGGGETRGTETHRRSCRRYGGHAC